MQNNKFVTSQYTLLPQQNLHHSLGNRPHYSLQHYTSKGKHATTIQFLFYAYTYRYIDRSFKVNNTWSRKSVQTEERLNSHSITRREVPWSKSPRNRQSRDSANYKECCRAYITQRSPSHAHALSNRDKKETGVGCAPSEWHPSNRPRRWRSAPWNRGPNCERNHNPYARIAHWSSELTSLNRRYQTTTTNCNTATKGKPLHQNLKFQYFPSWCVLSKPRTKPKPTRKAERMEQRQSAWNKEGGTTNMEVDSHTAHLKKLLAAKAAREEAKKSRADGASGSDPVGNQNNLGGKQQQQEDHHSTPTHEQQQMHSSEDRIKANAEWSNKSGKQRNVEEEQAWSTRTRSASKSTQDRSDGPSERRRGRSPSAKSTSKDRKRSPSNVGRSKSTSSQRGRTRSPTKKNTNT